MSSFPDRPLYSDKSCLQTARRMMETCCWGLIGEPEKGARLEGGVEEMRVRKWEQG